MSFLSKLFLLLSILTGLAFLLVAGALVAKDNNFEARHAKELIERQRDERLQDLQRHYLAGLKDRNLREVAHARTRALIAAGAAQIAVSEQDRVADIAEEVKSAVDTFERGLDFTRIQNDYQESMQNLVRRTRDLAQRSHQMVERKAALQEHLTNAEVEIARLREHLHVLDYNFYELRRSNLEFREVATLYLEADPTLAARGFGGPTRPTGIVEAVNAAYGSVVINRGSNEGVQPNQIFTIIDHRTGDFVAEIEVFEVHEMTSLARIRVETQQRPVNVNNTVRPRAITSGY